MSEAGGRHRNIWLVLSLCLNVVLIAMVAVGFARAWQREHDAQMGGAFSGQSIVAHLPADRAAKVQAVIDAHATKLAALADAAQQARLNARLVFMSPDYQTPVYAQAQAKILAADDALETEKMKQLTEIGVLLTPDERKAIVDRARHQPRKR
ncbi:MAG TPA: periplasmic heavy metal sensor [Rhizomicrobium sp.]|jgi:uncharacterized membrane protein